MPSQIMGRLRAPRNDALSIKFKKHQQQVIRH